MNYSVIKKAKWLFLLVVLFYSTDAISQKRNSIWCFGDSAGIDFNNVNNPQPFNSVIRSRGSCVSICDSIGNLLVYAAPTVTFITVADSFNVKVFNNNHNQLANGDSIVGEGWYYELAMIPSPGQANLFYLFSIGVTTNFGLYYSIIDMNQNGGSGAVMQKNVQLLNYRCSDGLTAVKHANGRDWWVLFRRGYLPTNEFYIYLVTPTGIQGPTITALGSLSNSAILRQVFSPDGNKLMIINWAGLIELFDFDRCTGLPSNPVNIEQENLSYVPCFLGGEFSNNSKVFYVTTERDTGYILQYNLDAPSPSLEKDTLYVYPPAPPYYPAGIPKRGPDGKIYVASPYYNGAQNFFPYEDSMYNSMNMNLSVINSPDSLRAACDLQLYSFYLGGKRSYLGLPNNPDYDLGPVVGSICDSLHTSVENLPSAKAELKIYYHGGWEVAYINAQQLKGRTYLLSVYDVSGKRIFSESGKLNSPYYTKSLNCQGFAGGVYLVTLETEQEKMTERFVRE